MSARHDECSEEAALLHPRSVAQVHAFRSNNRMLTMRRRPSNEPEQLPEGERWQDVRHLFYGVMAAALVVLLMINLVLPLFFADKGPKWWEIFKPVVSTAAVIVLVLTPCVTVTLCKRARRDYTSA
ncbi:hypothetical protein MTO96_044089 [Rhipicephalus appendiculatus]